jgi:hypothetical protein
MTPVVALNFDVYQFLLLEQLASMRAALFRYNPPYDFAAEYLLERLFKFMPPSLAMPIAPTREFWMHVLEAKIEATIRGEGEMIGWEYDNETVGPAALVAKQSLLRAIPCLLPVDDSPDGSLYRLVIEHGDFGIHNTTIAMQARSGEPLVTSLFDWETACVWPALLSDPLVAAGPVDLIVDENGRPSVTRLPAEATQADLETYAGWANHYIQVPIILPLDGILGWPKSKLTTFLPTRGSTTRRRATRRPYGREKTSVNCGLLCGTGCFSFPTLEAGF